MKAGPIGAFDYSYDTAGNVFPLRHAATGFGGHGVLASLGQDAVITLWFDAPPAVPRAGAAKLQITGVATVAAGYPENAEFKVEWERIAAGGTRTSLSLAADEWTKEGATDEYYHDDTLTEPLSVEIAGMPRQRGTFGALTAGQWDWTAAHTGGYASIVIMDPAGTGDPDATKTSNTYVQYVSVGDTFAPALNNEGTVTMSLISGDANKGATVYVPLDASTIVGGDIIKAKVTFLTANWTVNVLSAWRIRLVWE